MHSPLPDSSALEAGLIADETPARLSRLQENVRDLLRQSVINSVLGSVVATPSPTRRHATVEEDDETSPVHPHRPTPLEEVSPGVLFPPTTYSPATQHLAHESSILNIRALTALDHPHVMSDPSLPLCRRQGQHAVESSTRHHHSAWTRSRSHHTESHQQHHRRRRHNAKHRKRSREPHRLRLLTITVAFFLLAVLMGTYLALASTQPNTTPTFHILFILGILLATIVCAHALVRACILRPMTSPQRLPNLVILPPGRHSASSRHHRGRGRGGRQSRDREPLCASSPFDEERGSESGVGEGQDEQDFIPSPPIRVHFPTDDEAVHHPGLDPLFPSTQPGTAPPQHTQLDAQADCSSLKEMQHGPPHPPPPAYGRWRGSVRANPDLLHWSPVVAAEVVGTPGMPSPTYEEALGEGLPGGEAVGRTEGGGSQSGLWGEAPRPEMVELRRGLVVGAV